MEIYLIRQILYPRSFSVNDSILFTKNTQHYAKHCSMKIGWKEWMLIFFN